MLSGEPKNGRPFTRRILVKLRKRRKPITMFDSVNVAMIPKDAQAVAGYVNGFWPTYNQLVREFPHAHRLSVAVNSLHDAECLDVEKGDASPPEAAPWVRRQHRRGIARPVVYCSVSVAPQVVDLLARNGLKRNQYRLWTAHYTGKAHLCDRKCWAGFNTLADATQWYDRALGRNLDVSLCQPGFFQ